MLLLLQFSSHLLFRRTPHSCGTVLKSVVTGGRGQSARPAELTTTAVGVFFQTKCGRCLTTVRVQPCQEVLFRSPFLPVFLRLCLPLLISPSLTSPRRPSPLSLASLFCYIYAPHAFCPVRVVCHTGDAQKSPLFRDGGTYGAPRGEAGQGGGPCRVAVPRQVFMMQRGVGSPITLYVHYALLVS